MTQHTLKLSSDRVRALARAWVTRAPEGSLLRLITEPKHSDSQRDKLFAMLGDISKQCKAHGKPRSKETWKLLMLHALKYDVAFEMGLNGEPFPVGFSIKTLSPRQMSDLIEYCYHFGAENGVVWSERGWDMGEHR